MKRAYKQGNNWDCKKETIDFSFLLEDNKISEFEVNNKGNITTAKWVD